MQSTNITRATQAERRDEAGRKIIDATIALIAERGSNGFGLTDVAARAGVSRALPAYHFGSLGLLLDAAGRALLLGTTDLEELGLEPLLKWVGDQQDRARQRDPRLLATLQITLEPAVGEAFLRSKTDYWEWQVDRMKAHIERGQRNLEVRLDFVPTEIAATVTGLVHGELLRMIAHPDTQTSGIVGLLRSLLATPQQLSPKARPKIDRGESSGQLGLFKS